MMGGEERNHQEKKDSLVRIDTSFSTLERVQVLCMRKGQEAERPSKMGEHTGKCKGSGNIRREVVFGNLSLKRDTWEGQRLSHKDVQVK